MTVVVQVPGRKIDAEVIVLIAVAEKAGGVQFSYALNEPIRDEVKKEIAAKLEGFAAQHLTAT